MQVKGQAQLSAPRSRVWATLMSSDALQACIPGCQDFREVGPRQWEANMVVGLAGIKGSYKGKVSISDEEPESSYRMTVEGNGAGNRIRGSGLVTLSENARGGTDVSYDGEASVAGVLAIVGQRLFQPAVKTIADQFFSCMGSKVKT